MDANIRKFLKIIDNSKKMVFFDGTGVSTECGVLDFRSKDGLYNQKYIFPPEIILSNSFFMSNTEYFFEFYRNRLNSLDILPNIVHIKLAELEKKGVLKAIITQNVDGLHQKAGSKNVLELYGSILRNYCIECGRSHDAEYLFNKTTGIPRCQRMRCNGIVKPDIFLNDELLNEEIVDKAVKAILKSDTLIVAGTSLDVLPVSRFDKLF